MLSRRPIRRLFVIGQIHEQQTPETAEELEREGNPTALLDEWPLNDAGYEGRQDGVQDDWVRKQLDGVAHQRQCRVNIECAHELHGQSSCSE